MRTMDIWGRGDDMRYSTRIRVYGGGWIQGDMETSRKMDTRVHIVVKACVTFTFHQNHPSRITLF